MKAIKTMSENIFKQNIRDLETLLEDGTYSTSANHLNAIHSIGWSIQLKAEKLLRKLE